MDAHRLLRILAAGLIATFIPIASSQPVQTIAEGRDFISDGNVKVSLPRGNLRVVPVDSTRIQVRCTSSRGTSISKVKPVVEVTGTSAVITIKQPRGSLVDTEVQVPRQSNLVVEVGTGDLEVGPVAGNKNLKVRVGDIKLTLCKQCQYKELKALARVGDVSTGAPVNAKVGLGMKVHLVGAGDNVIEAHTSVGDIRINKEGFARELDGVDLRQ